MAFDSIQIIIFLNHSFEWDLAAFFNLDLFINPTEFEGGHGLRVPAFEEAVVDGDARDDEDIGQARLHLQHDEERARQLGRNSGDGNLISWKSD